MKRARRSIENIREPEPKPTIFDAKDASGEIKRIT